MADLGVIEVFTDVVNVAPAIQDDSFSVLSAKNDVPQGGNLKEPVAQCDDSFCVLQGLSHE